jgi:hypothetical protein
MPASAPASSGHNSTSNTINKPGGVAVPPTKPVETPQVTMPNTATPTTPTPPAAPVMQTDTSSSVNIQDLINTKIEQNCLNNYFQTTYHWRLFFAGDEDMVSRTGASDVQTLLGKVATLQQYTLAESGVTGFNIRDVKFSTMVANNPVTKSESAHSWVVTITEPNGISFLDAIIDGAYAAGMKNYTKAPFYMLLTFLGYDETGTVGVDKNQNFANNPANGFSNGGQWLWCLNCTNIEVKLTEGGATYTCSFMPNSSQHLADDYDIMRIPTPIRVKGDKLGPFLKDYIAQLNAQWKAKLNGELIIFDDIVFNNYEQFFKSPASAIGKKIEDFKMKPIKDEENPNRQWSMDGYKGDFTVNTLDGYTVPNFIIDAIKHTEEAQALAKDEPTQTQPDQSKSETNPKKFRETVSFVIETVLKLTGYDMTSGHYQRHYTIYVTPHYSQGPLITHTQADNGKSAQLGMVQALIDNGLLRKQYNYIFTGLNTEVINIDLAWKMDYSNRVKAYQGALMRYDANTKAAKLNPEQKPPQGNLTTVHEDQVVIVPLGSSGVPTTPTSTPAPSPTASPSRVAPGNTATPQASSNIYLEDLLAPTQDQNSPDYKVPPSFWQGNKEIDKETGQNGFVGAVTRDLSVAGSIFTQLTDNEAFQKLDLTIRGDPFWLGQTNLHRQIQLQYKPNNGLNVAANSLPDFASGNQIIQVNFRYPVTIGDDFVPVLTSSNAFNGLYQVTNINNYFSDGVFKQELTNCLRLPTIDPSLWSNQGNNTTPIASSNSPPQKSGTSKANPPSVGNTNSAISKTLGVANNAPTDAKAVALTQRLMSDFNLTQAQASGIVGNLQYESKGLNPAQGEIGGGGGYGLAQWTGVRLTDLQTYAANTGQPVDSLDTQYGFLSQELNGNHASSLAAVRNTNNVTDATVAFQDSYEIPAAATAHTDRRITAANNAYNLTSMAPPMTVASVP